MTSEPPRRIAKLVARFRIHSPCSDEELWKLQNAGKTCPVRRSLHPDVVVDETLRAGLRERGQLTPPGKGRDVRRRWRRAGRARAPRALPSRS